MLNHEPERADQHRRQALASALAGAAGGLLLSSSSDAAETIQPVKRTALHPSGAPAADAGYSPAIVAEGGHRLLFISGQGPEDLKADMETQIRQTFDRIGLLLKEAGGSFANVVIVRSYWVHMLRDLAAFRKVRKEYLVEPYPASTAVGTPELAIPGLELEIEVVAVL
jgi:enamine deaminase RidA (YjgF/YER057c/UK114 family)